jgi:succinylarginine dihydrolase
MYTLAYEVNFDGIVGPTHNYSGLAYGNTASMANEKTPSNPKMAALQGLEKMKFLADRGIKQAVLPPCPRPHIPTLRTLGFTGTPETILERVYKETPWLLQMAGSASSMWAANAATVCPSIDSISQHLNFTPANLCASLHRSIETQTTVKILKGIFPNPIFFEHHDPLPLNPLFGDEGAANHTRFSKTYEGPGVHLFVYGIEKMAERPYGPKKFPARQTLEASQAIARKHQIYPKQVVFAQANPDAIDAGVFHNDVAAVGNLNLFFFHELAFFDPELLVNQLKRAVADHCDTEMIFIKVKKQEISLETAVKSYLFNSQLVTMPDGSMSLIAPTECLEYPDVQNYLKNLTSAPENPINQVHYLDIRQSMKNGGGPACLRLRVVLNENELAETNPDVFLTNTLYTKLVAWVNQYYRDRLLPDDLRDPQLFRETQTALDHLSKILNLPDIYNF